MIRAISTSLCRRFPPVAASVALLTGRVDSQLKGSGSFASMWGLRSAGKLGCDGGGDHRWPVPRPSGRRERGVRFTPTRRETTTPRGMYQEPSCTIREAISAANGARPGKDVVVLRGGKTYKVTHDPSNVEDIVNAGADLDVTDDLTIKAKRGGYAVLDAKHKNRVLDLSPQVTAEVKLSDLWVRNGLSSTGGAGIRAGAGGDVDLVASHIKLTGSKVNSYSPGGGIEIADSMSGNSTARITDSTISWGNGTVDGDGGGLAGVDVGVVTVADSTISGNKAGDASNEGSGGGIYLINNDTTLEMSNSTVANNRASRDGGGIETFSASVELTNVTIAGNRADFEHDDSGEGGGIKLSSSSSATVANTILALNRPATPPPSAP